MKRLITITMDNARNNNIFVKSLGLKLREKISNP